MDHIKNARRLKNLLKQRYMDRPMLVTWMLTYRCVISLSIYSTFVHTLTVLIYYKYVIIS